MSKKIVIIPVYCAPELGGPKGDVVVARFENERLTSTVTVNPFQRFSEATGLRADRYRGGNITNFARGVQAAAGIPVYIRHTKQLPRGRVVVHETPVVIRATSYLLPEIYMFGMLWELNKWGAAERDFKLCPP